MPGSRVLASTKVRIVLILGGWLRNLYKDDPRLDARPIRRNASGLCLWPGNTSRLEVDLPRVQGTNDSVTGDNSFRQRAALVRTSPVDSKEPVTKIEDRDVAPADVHRSTFTQGNILHGCDANPLFVTHACTFSSGSICTNCVGCRGASPSSHASREMRLDFLNRSLKPCWIASGA